MGLLFTMPSDESEIDRLKITNNKVILKSYGLPMIFWGYLAAIMATIFIMFIAIKGPLFKVISGEDPINQAIGICVLIVFIAIPLILLAFYFYEKTIIKTPESIKLIHKIFWIPVWTKTLPLEDSSKIEIEHYLDSPNVAKLHNEESLKAFQNRGYHLIVLKIGDKKHTIDRSSQRHTLKKTLELLHRA